MCLQKHHAGFGVPVRVERREALDQAQVIRGFKFSGGTPVVANDGGVEDGLISRSAVNQALLIHQF